MIKKTASQERFDQRDATLGFLARAASATDVIAFVKLDNVFTSAMTGNTALLGLALGQGHIAAAFNSLVALGGYIGGVALGALIHARDKQRELILTLLAEILLLGLWYGLWLFNGFPQGHGNALLYAMILPLSLAMGVQSVVARRINVEGIPTVVFTSTLTSIVMTLMHATVRGRGATSLFNAKRQSLAFLTYAAGATLTALLLWRWNTMAVSIPLLGLVLALILCLQPTQSTHVHHSGLR